MSTLKPINYFFIALAFSGSAQAAEKCSALFSEKVATFETQNYISKTIDDFAYLRLNLDLEKAKGRTSIEWTALSADYLIKERDFIHFVEGYGIMTRAQFIEKVKSTISDIQNGKNEAALKRARDLEEKARRLKEDESNILESEIDGSFAIFHRVEPGDFKMGPPGRKVDVTITKPFEMLATPITLNIFKYVADLAKARYPKDYLNMYADPSSKVTLPTTFVNYYNVELWLQALNALSRNGEDISEMFRGHKPGDRYRLPTEAEWEFVVRGRGKYNELYPFGSETALLEQYAWYTSNSKWKAHPVAEKLPVIVDGKKFYDMLGNVVEWTQDIYQEKLPGGVDPQGAAFGDRYVLRGGGFNTSTQYVDSSHRESKQATESAGHAGFRIVREVRP